MDKLATVVSILGALMEYKSIIVPTVGALTDFGKIIFSKVSGGVAPTEEESAELERKCDEMFENSQEPLPPAQPGDPDFKP